MNQEEMKKEFNELYDMMASSSRTEYMRTFGCVMKDMMEWMIQNKPEMADEYIGKLESIRWKNYLTRKEAEKIVSSMSPRAPWSRDVWNQAMDGYSLTKEYEPYYNSCALWVTMNKVYTNSSETIARIMGMEVAEVPQDKMVKAVYGLALDELCDTDSKVSIRHAYGL